MNWLKAFLSSSVGRKFLVGLTGLFLCFFLVVHLAGNLLLYVGNGSLYNEYAHKLHANEEFLIVAETLLFGAFAVHIVIAAWLTAGNVAARRKRYAETLTKRDDRILNSFTPDKTMFLTGFFVLAFLIVHLSDFKFEVGWSELEHATPYQKATTVLANFWRQGIYLVGAVFLGYHVSHGFQSAFQSLGLNHPKYTGCLRKLSLVFGLVVALGFGSFPVSGIVRSLTHGDQTAAPEEIPSVPAHP